MLRRLEKMINQPATDMVVVVLILISVGLLVLECILPEHTRTFEIVENAGHVLTGVFILELLLRFAAMSHKRRFFRMYWLDILAVLPVTRTLRILRVLRLLRLFRVGVLVNRRLSILRAAFHQGKSEMLTVVVVVLIIVLTGAIGINLVERGENNSFQTIEGSTWWSLYALVAGEMVDTPKTFLGRMLALFVMLGGLGFFAMFTGIISAAMVNRLSRRMEVRDVELDDLSGHIVICGWSRVGIRVLEEIEADKQLYNRSVVLVAELDIPPYLDAVPKLQDQLYFVKGDHTRIDVLEKAGIERAHSAILLADETGTRSNQDRDARTVLAALTIEKLNHGIFTCVELLNKDNRSHLEMAGVEEIIVPGDYAGRIIAASSRTRGLVPIFDELLTSRYGNQIYKAELRHDWNGKKVGWVHQKIKEEFNATLLSIERVTDSKREVFVNPPSEKLLMTGDKIIFIAESFPDGMGEETIEAAD